VILLTITSPECQLDAAILDFKKIRNFNGQCAERGHYESTYHNSSKSVKHLQRYGDLTVFTKWRPSVILDLLARIRTTDDDYSMVFIVMQNLVDIDEVVSIV